MTIEEKKKTLNPNINTKRKKNHLRKRIYQTKTLKQYGTINKIAPTRHVKLANIYQNSHLSIETVSPSQRGISEMIAEHIWLNTVNST